MISGKVEDVEFAVAQNLAGGAVENENVIVDRLQKLHGLVVERRVTAQEQGIEFGDGFENKIVLLGAADDRLPVFRHTQARATVMLRMRATTWSVADIYVVRLQEIDRMPPLVAFVHQVAGGFVFRLDASSGSIR
jgi:hypothetical protein